METRNRNTTFNRDRSEPMDALERTSNDKGKHAELPAQTALLANCYSVMQPISPQPYDLAARKPQTQETVYFQVKTAFLRDEERYGGEYLVVKGARNNGKVYEIDEVDRF